MLLLHLQFGGVFDGDDAFLFADEAGEGVEHRGFAGTRTAADDDVQAGFDGTGEEVDDAWGEGVEADQIVDGEQPLAEAANGHDGAVERDGRDDGADAGAVAQAGIDDRRRVVDTAADVGDDAIDDGADVGGVFEADAGFDDFAEAFNVDGIGAIDHDVADGHILHQRFERAEAEHLIEHLFDEPVAFAGVERNAFVANDALNADAQLFTHAVLVQRPQLLRREDG